MSYVDTRLHRALRLPDALPYDTEIHEHDCQCDACEPYAPSVEPRLTANDIGILAIAGAVVGSAIAFAIDAHGAAAALASCFGVAL
jgi:hypothetical protein